jgi:hypothetical protein
MLYDGCGVTLRRPSDQRLLSVGAVIPIFRLTRYSGKLPA